MAAGFLSDPPEGEGAERLFAADRDDPGYVMALTRVWAHAPEVEAAWEAFTVAAATAGGLSLRQKGIVVSALAGALGDAYCSLAWGTRLAAASSDGTAAAVLAGDDGGLDERERVLAAWVRRVARDPNGTTAEDVERLRAAGFGDRAILGVTAYVGARMAFSAVNDALGAAPDAALAAAAPPAVRAAVRYGRAPGE
ncbi:carboxymuconolactone decarboxylase family protein [Agrococcus terreus]|uniref:Alkylhydroperoxidase family enzyme, contains CxxC motif n=1 Tax=Agrococcus terreus TaxID=574649 RepID=A0ABQ2KQA7_9MICO|nr:hypothetical protein [Agrococcus terreus]GGN86850.1 hypothetical protein GCM10010968_20760 [Agrococcus terreus]